MTKAETLDMLLDSAIECFSKFGYQGASLREIARNASVTLSTIHFYFASKAELYTAARRYAWGQIDDERHALLSDAEGRSGDVSLEQLVYCLANPVVRRALSPEPRDRALVFVIRSNMTFASSSETGSMFHLADRTASRWVDGIIACCPGLSREDGFWAFSYMISAVYSWQLVDHRYDHMIGAERGRSIDTVCKDIVAFCSGGIREIEKKRKSER
mgnify:CR=1 FL=1